MKKTLTPAHTQITQIYFRLLLRSRNGESELKKEYDLHYSYQFAVPFLSTKQQFQPITSTIYQNY